MSVLDVVKSVGINSGNLDSSLSLAFAREFYIIKGIQEIKDRVMDGVLSVVDSPGVNAGNIGSYLSKATSRDYYILKALKEYQDGIFSVENLSTINDLVLAFEGDDFLQGHLVPSFGNYFAGDSGGGFYTLNFDGGFAAFQIGEAILGTTSNAFGQCGRVQGTTATGTLSLFNVSSEFADNEFLAGIHSGGGGFVNGSLVKPTRRVSGAIRIGTASSHLTFYNPSDWTFLHNGVADKLLIGFTVTIAASASEKTIVSTNDGVDTKQGIFIRQKSSGNLAIEVTKASAGNKVYLIDYPGAFDGSKKTFMVLIDQVANVAQLLDKDGNVLDSSVQLNAPVLTNPQIPMLIGSATIANGKPLASGDSVERFMICSGSNIDSETVTRFSNALQYGWI